MIFEDVEQIFQLALNLSSDDIVESKEAQLELSRFMAPNHIINMWRQSKENIAVALLNEAEKVGSHEVYDIIGNGFKQLFNTASNKSLAEEFLKLDSNFIVARFLIRSFFNDDLFIATTVRSALLALLIVIPPELAPSVGEILSKDFKNEKFLRLFDENNPESSENEKLCKFLDKYTDLISFIASSTVNAFENDLLLVANYLIICGIIARYANMPNYFLERVEMELTKNSDEICFCFVCQACAIALRNHESNALKFASLWGTAVSRHLLNCGNDAKDAIFHLIGAASTTLTGWNNVKLLVNEKEILTCLKISSIRATVLIFLTVLIRAAHISDSFFKISILHAAWELRSDPDDNVREQLWEFIKSSLQREIIMITLAPLCAAFISSFPQEMSVKVRSLQIEVAAHLEEYGGLAKEVQEILKQFRSRGLYPPLSVGVEALSRS